MQEFFFRNHIEEKVLAVGVSGGADSLALVLQAKEQLTVYGYKIIALTVNHKLRPSADAEAEYVASIMKKYKIEHYILVWVGEKPENGIEEAARIARYSLMKKWCDENGVKVLLTAHHLYDQAETFLMRLQRGSGLQGLCAMREISEWNGLKIARPLLNTSPENLKLYLRDKGVQWIEDESNNDIHYLRNKTRKFIPVLERETGISVDRIGEAVANLQNADNFIESKVDELFLSSVRNDGAGVFSFAYNDYLKWHRELKFRVFSRLCRRQYIPRADSILYVIHSLNTLPFTGMTLGKKEIFMAYGRVWLVPEMAAKRNAVREVWEDFLIKNPQFKGVKIPYKARLALVKGSVDLV